MSANTPCPTCSGKGFNWSSRNQNKDAPKVECPACNGTGLAPQSTEGEAAASKYYWCWSCFTAGVPMPGNTECGNCSAPGLVEIPGRPYHEALPSADSRVSAEANEAPCPICGEPIPSSWNGICIRHTPAYEPQQPKTELDRILICLVQDASSIKIGTVISKTAIYNEARTQLLQYIEGELQHMANLATLRIKSTSAFQPLYAELDRDKAINIARNAAVGIVDHTLAEQRRRLEGR